MRIIGVVVAIIGGCMMMYLMAFINGSIFDQIAFVTSGLTIYGKPEWVTLAVSRFQLVYVAGLGLSIAMIIWGFFQAIKTADYEREW